MIKIVQTERLEIKPFSEADIPSLEALLTNDEIKKNFMIPDFADRMAVHEAACKLHRQSLADAHLMRGIYRENHLIGFVNEVDSEADTIEVGYVIHPDFHNRGYATEMLSAVIRSLLKCFTTVEAGAFVNNTASIRVMQKCGMRRIDKEENITYHGEARHCIYYAISINQG